MATNSIVEKTIEFVERPIFVIRKNAESLGYVVDEAHAEEALSILVKKEEAALKDIKTSTYTKREGNVISIYTRSIGYFVNGFLTKRVILDYVAVKGAMVTEKVIEEVEEATS